jgi:16S rRNA processing protein RimM
MLPKPAEGSYYKSQLRGCRVVTSEGQDLGEVTDVLDFGGTGILKVDRDNVETLIPFAESYMRRIDLDQRRIEVDLPEDLRDLNK